MTDRQRVLERLRDLLAERLVTDEATLEQHAGDACHHEPRRPDCVVFAESNEDVAATLRICHETRTPVIPFGAGTGVVGGVVAICGGVSLDLTRMNQILRVSPEDMDATVQAGVTRQQLNRHLREAGWPLFFSVDPGAESTLGGMVATSASGGATVRYGAMRENTMGLTAITATGSIIKTGGRARKSSAGYDLTRLLVGSEGTLAVITEVTVRLQRSPTAITAAVCPFPSMERAIDAAQSILQAGIPVARLELLDATLVEAVNRYSQLDNAVTPTLFLEFHGEAEEVEQHAVRASVKCADCDGGDFRWASDADRRKRLWQARYDAYYACLAMREQSAGYVTDVCVPVSQLANCIAETQAVVDKSEIPSPLFGHVGDGNFHVVFLIREGDARELREVDRMNDRIVEIALRRQGTCTGE
ncbi:MAG: FAD-linked oxidase C-terminal domain-containing protein, partial [Pirellulaceae bacterium]|nr:FAD-linked oxidase C-terminal domain-containing protein [Pirellulaceae bacterium]